MLKITTSTNKNQISVSSTEPQAACKVNNNPLEYYSLDAKESARKAKQQADIASQKLEEINQVFNDTQNTLSSQEQEILNNIQEKQEETIEAVNTAGLQQIQAATEKVNQILSINPANANLSNLTEAGIETIKNAVSEELNNPFFLGMSHYFNVAPNNLSWLKSEGQWNSKAVYPDYYNWCLEQLNSNTDSFTTSSDDYSDFDWVINTADETFRLPLQKENSIYIDWNSEQTISSLPFTVPYDSYVFVTCERRENENNNGYITVNGKSCIAFKNIAGYTVGSDTTQLLLKKGDVVNAAGSSVFTEGKYYKPKNNDKLYYYVGETVQNTNLINTGSIAEQLAGKLDSSSVKAYITETYQSGNSWYRIWSDGWCEQGGVKQAGSVNVTFLKMFNNTNYCFVIYYNSVNNASAYHTAAYYLKSKTKSGIQLSDGGFSGNWHAQGYIY